jgi:hypothetical protein
MQAYGGLYIVASLLWLSGVEGVRPAGTFPARRFVFLAPPLFFWDHATKAPRPLVRTEVVKP